MRARNTAILGGVPSVRNRSFSLRTLQSGRDRRSIAQAQRVRALARRSPSRIRELVLLVEDEDCLVSMRAFDVLEKLANDAPEGIQPYKRLFIGPLADSDQWEIRLQIVRTLPLLHWTSRERKRVVEILKRDLEHPQKFVRAWALDSLTRFAERDPSLRSTVSDALDAFERSGSRALATRARHIRERMTALYLTRDHGRRRSPPRSQSPR